MENVHCQMYATLGDEMRQLISNRNTTSYMIEDTVDAVNEYTICKYGHLAIIEDPISSEYLLVKFANKEAVVIYKFTKVRVLLDGVDVDLLKRFVHTINTHFEDVKLELEMRAMYD